MREKIAEYLENKNEHVARQILRDLGKSIVLKMMSINEKNEKELVSYTTQKLGVKTT